MNEEELERRKHQAELTELATESRQAESNEGGQSGDIEELPSDGEAADESVEELAEDDQAFEASVIDGVERAGDHPERPVRSHEDKRPALESELPPDPDWK
jgi:hypothetical protein